MSKLRWTNNDVRQLGVFIKSFLLKGRIINEGIKLSEIDEDLYNYIKLIYKLMIDRLIYAYILEMDGKKEEIYGKRQKREKGVTASILFLDDINKSYMEDWGEKIDFESLSDFQRKRSKNISSKLEETRTNLTNEKGARLQKMLSNTLKMIDEFFVANQQIGTPEIKDNFIKIITDKLNQQTLQE